MIAPYLLKLLPGGLHVDLSVDTMPCYMLPTHTVGKQGNALKDSGACERHSVGEGTADNLSAVLTWR
jgi:hypothetical protein